MPSLIVGQPVASGPMKIASGNPWSGRVPWGGLEIKLDRIASGAVYVGFSGNVTLNSGAFLLSGGSYSGSLDGFPVNPGETFHVPYSMLASGEYNVFLWHDVACSGQGRVYFQPLFAR